MKVAWMFGKLLHDLVLWQWVSRNINESKLMCHNPSLGLATKVRACEGAGQE